MRVAQAAEPERRIIRQVSPASVARLVLGVGLSLVAVVMIGLVALWLLALASGAMRSVDAFIEDLGLSINVVGLLSGLFVFLLVACVLATMVAGLLAVLYNLLAEVFGGVEVVTRERRSRSAPRAR